MFILRARKFFADQSFKRHKTKASKLRIKGNLPAGDREQERARGAAVKSIGFQRRIDQRDILSGRKRGRSSS